MLDFFTKAPRKSDWLIYVEKSDIMSEVFHARVSKNIEFSKNNDNKLIFNVLKGMKEDFGKPMFL